MGKYGIKMGRDCTCKEEDVVVDPSLEEIEEVEEELIQLDFQDDDNATKETEKLEALEEELIEDSFPPGCSWECYLGNYVDLSKKLQNTEEAALEHYLNHGIKMGRDCTCKEEDVVVDPSLEEKLIEDTFPPGCSWECYLGNYIELSDQLPLTEEAALDHYLNHGIKQGRDCSCKMVEDTEDSMGGK